MDSSEPSRGIGYIILIRSSHTIIYYILYITLYIYIYIYIEFILYYIFYVRLQGDWGALRRSTGRTRHRIHGGHWQITAAFCRLGFRVSGLGFVPATVACMLQSLPDHICLAVN